MTSQTPDGDRLRKAYDVMRQMKARLDALQRTRTEPIAVVGVGCRFPGGVRSPEDYWQLLQDRRDTIGLVPPERWDAEALYDPDPAAPGKIYSKWGSFMNGVDQFDARFFNIPPREAAAMDPQQRMLLEVVWEALERAGLPDNRLRGTDVGVFLGINQADYYTNQLHGSPSDQLDYYTAIGNSLSVAAGRIAFALGWHGPTLSVDTACSSSLVAAHLAVRALRNGECHTAVASGVNLILAPEVSMMTSRMRAMAPDGRCKAFDARADGYTRGEGCGAVVLRRLSDAEADGDPVLAVIRGSAINHDGASSGVTVPSARAQQRLLDRTLEDAHLDATDVEYVEAHGTGTRLGDPIEVRSLRAALGAGRAEDAPLIIGSVKTNLGHLEAAAGVAGLIKVILAIAHDEIPAQLYAEERNPRIDWSGWPVEVATRARAWRDERRIAGVSSFGISGTNAHLLLSAPPLGPARTPDPDPVWERRPFVLPVSARHPEARERLADLYRGALADDDAPAVRDLCYTAALRRTHHEHRLGIVGASADEVRAQLHRALNGEVGGGVARGEAPPEGAAVAFVFSGQGSLWDGMAHDLLAAEPAFASAVDRCDAALRPHLGWSVRDRLDAEAPIDPDDITVVQPVQFTMHVGLAALWESWGVRPAAVVGHSLGEVAAAFVVGVLTLEAAAHVVALRSRLFASLDGRGAMGLVGMGLDEVTTRIADRPELDVGAHNGPSTTVVSGAADAVGAFLEEAAAEGRFTRLISTSAVAGHSHQVDPVLDALREGLAGLEPGSAVIPFYSTVTGDRLDGPELVADYWVRNVRETVRFWPAMEALLDEGIRAIVEVSPHPILLPGVQASVRDQDRPPALVPTLQRDGDPRRALAESLAALYAVGVEVDWSAYTAEGVHVTLPVYPWQHEAYWLDSVAAGALASASGRRAAPGGEAHPMLGTHVSVAPGTDIWTRTGTAPAPDLLVTAARVRLGVPCVGLDVRFVEALSADVARVQTVAVERACGAVDFEVLSRPSDDGRWSHHAAARFRLAAADPPPRATPDAEAYDDTWSEGPLVERLGAPAQWFSEVGRREGSATGRLAGVPPLSGLLSAAAAALYAAAPLHVRVRGAADRLSPASVERLYHVPDGEPVVLHATTLEASGLVGDVWALDAADDVVALFEGLTLEPQGHRASETSAGPPPTLAPGAAPPVQATPPVGVTPPDVPALDRVLTASGAERSERLAELLRDRAAAVLGLAAAEVGLDQPLIRLGLNSLMVFELRNWIKGSLGVQVPMEAFAADFTLREIVNKVDSLLPGGHASAPAASAPAASAPAASAPAASAPAEAAGATWTVRFQPQPDAELRIFGFAHAGGGPALFRSWADHLPPSIECCAVQLPGRAERMREAPVGHLGQLVDALADGLAPMLDRPFAFFGHSFGGLVSYALARRLAEVGRPGPIRMFVSASRSPQLPNPHPLLHPLNDEDFLDRLATYGGIPAPLLDDREMLAFFVPTIRADFQALERYIHPSGPPLSAPISGLAAVDDRTVRVDEVDAWRDVTSGPFALHTFEGGHFYLNDRAEEVVETVLSELFADVPTLA